MDLFGRYKDICVKTVRIDCGNRKMPALVLSPKGEVKNAPGVLWLHGGGYITGMKEMAGFTRAIDLVREFGAVVVSPDYRLAFLHPYPAAVKDAYEALIYIRRNWKELGINKNQLMVGGESAGGGLCAAVCMLAKDRGKIHIAFQMPLYPMLDNLDTGTSENNHGRVWNTARNHFAWGRYLRGDAKSDKVSCYASPARRADYSALPPAYTFVGDGEPFYAETCTYIENLKKAGVEADMDVYSTDLHAFDLFSPGKEPGSIAIARFLDRFAYAKTHFFAEQP